MARTRTIYQTDLLYVGPTGANSATGKHFQGATYGVANNVDAAYAGANLVGQLYRVQNVSYNFNKTLTDVNQIGELAAIDRIPLEPPTVSLSFSYLIANLANEKNLGFTISSGSPISAISGFLNGTTDTKNYFLLRAPEGNDAVDYTTYDTANNSVIGIGNGFISNYTTEGSVGAFPTASVTVEGLNLEFELGSSGIPIPAVNQTNGVGVTGWWVALPEGDQSIGAGSINSNNRSLSVLRPGDITLTLGLNAGDGGFSESDLKIQSYSISYDLRREDLRKLGSKYAFSKVIQFPVQATMTVTAEQGDLQTGSLIEIVNNNKNFNPKVVIKKPDDANQVIAQYELRGAKLDNQDGSTDIGRNASVTMTFTTQIGGPQQTSVGVFLSGIV